MHSLLLCIHHCRNVRPKLSADQQHQLKECFELMDQDGSGAIGADELGAAFKLLGELLLFQVL